MTSHEILKADVLDILFNNRNKQYGAYALRRSYPSHLRNALVGALGLCTLLFLLIRTGGATKPVFDLPDKAPVIVRTADVLPLPPTQPPPPARVAPRPPLAQANFTPNIVLVQTVDPRVAMAPVEELLHLPPGNANVDGPAPTTPQGGEKPAAAGSGGGEEEEKQPGAFVPVERQPEFPGGPKAWAEFLNRNLQTPDDLAPGERRVVRISFQVDTEGRVTGFRVMESGGRAFDEEVIRVLKRMPRWKPAIQNGHPITVSFTQPVTFVPLEH
jgi:protein TonB